MNVVEVTGETVSKLSRLVKKAGEQQRAIVLELSKELGQHNILIERALEKETRLLQKVQRIEDHIMTKEMYHYEEIRAKLEAQKEEEKRKREEQERKERQERERRLAETRERQREMSGGAASQEESKLLSGSASSSGTDTRRTGDPFKDFQIDLEKFQSDEEATKYVKLGRESTYHFIDLLYRTDWHYEKKTADGIKVYSMRDVPGEKHSYARFETKFGQVTVSELVEYYTVIDKRLAWENNFYASLEQVKSYPMLTNMYYGKLVGKKGANQKDNLMITHGVEIKGNRQYLTCLSVDHHEYPPAKKANRHICTIYSNYFEPTADGKGVKNIVIVQMPQGLGQSESSLTKSFSKEGSNQVHIQSITNLKNLLKGTRQTKANTTYLVRAAAEDEPEPVVPTSSIEPAEETKATDKKEQPAQIIEEETPIAQAEAEQNETSPAKAAESDGDNKVGKGEDQGDDAEDQEKDQD